jgi:hypothetical protein
VGRLPALEGTDLAMRSAVEEPREGGHERSIDAMGNSGSPKRASEDSRGSGQNGCTVGCTVGGGGAHALMFCGLMAGGLAGGGGTSGAAGQLPPPQPTVWCERRSWPTDTARACRGSTSCAFGPHQ